MTAHTAGEAHEVVSDTRRLYERLVHSLRERAVEMQNAGVNSEAIAHVLHAERRALSKRFKQLTPEPLRTRLYERSFWVYGDRFGPTIEYLREAGKSWTQIIESATRPGSNPFQSHRKR